MEINFLQAFNGDSIIIHFENEGVTRHILIDGGPGSTYMQKGRRGKLEYNDLKKEIESIKNKGEHVDLLILTHVDDDHIGGILKWFETDKDALELVRKIWFNSGRTIKNEFENDKTQEYDNSIEFSDSTSLNTSIRQGVKFEDKIKSKPNIWDEKVIEAEQMLSLYGIDFKILSPDRERLNALLGKWELERPESIDTSASLNDYDRTLLQLIEEDVFEEDTSRHNGSSISFVLSYNDKNYLFLADSFPSVIISSLKKLGCSEQSPLECEFVKVSHHGSKANNSYELLKLISSKKFIISTNGAKHSHPNKQFLARLINQNSDCEIFFNYPELIDKIFKEEDYTAFPNFTALQVKGAF